MKNFANNSKSINSDFRITGMDARDTYGTSYPGYGVAGKTCNTHRVAGRPLPPAEMGECVIPDNDLSRLKGGENFYDTSTQGAGAPCYPMIKKKWRLERKGNGVCEDREKIRGQNPIIALLIFLIPLLLIFSTSCSFLRNREQSKQVDIIYTANLQGAILDLPCNNTVGKAEFYTLPRVMAKVQQMLKKCAADGIPAIAVDGGNTLFGIDDLSWSRKGKPAIYLMKTAGVSALAMGEVEFVAGDLIQWKDPYSYRSDSPATPFPTEEPEFNNSAGKGPLPLAKSKENKGNNANFIIFAGNITDKRLFKPLTPGENNKNIDMTSLKKDLSSHFTKEINGIKVSFYSYFEPEESPLLPGIQEKYLYAEFDTSVEKLNDALQKDDAQYKIVIARVNDIMKFAGALKGADLVIPGRYDDSLHPVEVDRINDINVLPFVNSRYMGVARIRLTKGPRGNTEVKFDLEKPGEEKMPAKADLTPYLDKFYKTYSKEYSKVHTAFIGYGDERLKHTSGTPQETPTAFAVADMIRNYAGTDIALINLFSVRRPLAGIIRGEDVEWISPFGNRLVTLDLTGEQIREIMKLNLRRDTKFMIISGGSIAYEGDKNVKLLIDGYPLDPNKTYRVATNDYLADSDKMEYRVFKLGKHVHKTEIPINGIFFESVLKRRFIGLPPERVGLKTKEEIEKIEDPLKAGREAYKWGYFKLAYDLLEKATKIKPSSSGVDVEGASESINEETKLIVQANIDLYAGLPGCSYAKAWHVSDRFREDMEINSKENSVGYRYAELIRVASYYSMMMFFDISGQYSRTSIDSKKNKELNILVSSACFRNRYFFNPGYFLEDASKNFPSDIRLRRLAEAVGEAQAALSGKTEASLKPPLWPMFKGDGRHTGRSPFTGPASKKVKVLWKFQTHHSNKSSPAVAADGTLYIAGGDGILYALSPDGKLRWNLTIGGYLLSSPAIDSEGTIYLGAGSAAGETRKQTFRQGQAEEKQEKIGFICAFSPDGTQKWRFKTGGWVASSILITSGGNIVAGCNDNFIYCLGKDGELLWKFETGGKVFSSPAEDKDGNIYAGSEDSYFYSLDKDGKLRWKHKAENKFFSSPAISDEGIIYTGNDDAHLYAFKPDGTPVWKKKFPEAITSTPSIGRDGDLYVGCEDGKLYCLTPGGEIKWTFDREDEFFSSPIIDKNGNIYIGNEDNSLYCISPEGKMLWKFETGDYVESTPVVAVDGRVYLCAEDKFVYVIGEDKAGENK